MFLANIPTYYEKFMGQIKKCKKNSDVFTVIPC